MFSPRARLFALVATLVALLAAAAPAHAHFFCHMRERVVSACCCPKSEAPSDRAALPTAGAPDCCDRIVSVGQTAVATTADVNASVPPAAMVAVLVAYGSVELAREVALRATAQARAPPAIRPPAFISF